MSDKPKPTGPIPADNARRATIATDCTRVAAPNPATAASPSVATAAVTTAIPAGLIAFESDAGRPTRTISVSDVRRSSKSDPQ